MWLDADFPESLVYEPQPDGTKQLVSAMFMLPPDTPLEDVPDWGGALMQWHIHDDLCFTDDPDGTTGRQRHVGRRHVLAAVGQVRTGADDPRVDRPARVRPVRRARRRRRRADPRG